MYDCPIDYFKDNLIFGRDRSCWAIFELKGFDYDLLSDESKIGILNKLTLFISNVIEAKFMIIPVTQDLESQFEALTSKLKKDDVLYESALTQAQATKDYLSQVVDANGKSNDYKTFVAMKLQKDGEVELATQAKEMLDFLVKSILNDFNAFMHVDAKDIRKSKIEEYQKLSHQLYTEQNRRMRLLPVDANTTQWLLRRLTYRGLKKEVQLFYKSHQEPWQPYASEVTLAGNPYIRPRKRELVNLFSGVIRKRKRVLQIEHDDATSYQTFLVMTNIPDELQFPDCEWIYLLQQCHQQAEIYIHVKNVEHREALKKVENQRRSANSQVENITKAEAELPDELLESKQAIEHLEYELKSAKYPLTQTTVTICLADESLERLEEKVSYIRREYADLNFVLERPLADQYALFMSTIPTVSFTVQDFIMRLTPMTVASGMIGATHDLGNPVGPFVGTTGVEQKSVYLDLRQACLSNKSATAVFYGDLGYGKSFNANLLLYLHVLYGGYGLVIDPKGERGHWVTDLPNFEGLVTQVTLSPDATYKGTLDPFNVFRHNMEEASELALNLLSELFRLNPHDLMYTALLEALHRIKSDATPSMQRLAEILETFPESDDLCKDARLLARQIRLLQNSGMAQLFIGTGTEQSIQLENRLNILQIQNLRLPSPNTKKDDYTQEENISMVLMMVITAFVRKFVHSHPNHFKIILFDESWMLGKTVEGEKVLSYVGRMSRSLYSSMILNGHSVTDIPNEGIKNSVTYKFFFHTSNVDEAKRMLEMMRLEPTPSNIDRIMSLENAECLFQDLNGRVGVLKFDAIFQELIDVFSTTPTDVSEQKE